MDTKTTLTRTVDGRELPTPGRYRIDPVHSNVQFIARHMMISKVRGRFRDFTATIVIGDTLEESSVEVVMKAASIDTGDDTRDEHLRSRDFLDVARYPEITYRSTSVRPAGERYEVTGELTIRGVTRPVTISVEFCGVAVDPWGNARLGLLGTTEINRDEFDITWNQSLETGGFLVGKGVKVELDIEAAREPGSA